jgi:glycosyltransferase involved in cell wall biosynthesis
MTKSVLILNWKDITHPKAGGAEIVIHELAKRLVNDGNQVTLLTSAFAESTTDKSAIYEVIDGINIIRVGENKFFHSFIAANYYRKNLKNKFDIVIECVNTAPYFINFFKGKEKVFLFYHQLAREIWFYETSFALSIIGYLLEPVYTWIQSRFRNKVITVSESSKTDLTKYGFNKNLIQIITQGTNVQDPAICELRNAHNPILYLGSLRAMKRPSHALRAFQVLNSKLQITNSRFIVAGAGNELDKMKAFVKANNLEEKVEFKGKVDEETKYDLMKNAFVLIVPSLKEGWGLVVTEAARLGTPSIVYDVDGLRDSVKNGVTGFVVKNSSPDAIAEKIEYLIQNPDIYNQMRKNCIESSSINTFENSYADFKRILGL